MRIGGRTRIRASPATSAMTPLAAKLAGDVGLERGDDEVGERLLERDVEAAGGDVEQRRLQSAP